MTKFTAVDGQTMIDVCMNTYGTTDEMVKLLLDNNHPDVNTYPKTGQVFMYDETLIIDQQTSRTTLLNNIKYTTAPGNNNSVFYVIKEGLPRK